MKAFFKTNQKHLICLVTCLLFIPISSFAQIAITKFANGSFCSTYPTPYQSGSFSIRETGVATTKGFTKGQTSKTLIMGISAGFEFKPSTGTVTVTGTEVTIVGSPVITASTITVTLTTSATNVELNTLNFNNIEVRATAAGSGNIFRSGGTLLINNKTTRPATTTSWGTLSSLIPITFTSSANTRSSVAKVFAGTSDNQIIGMEVVVSGTCSSIPVTSFSITDASDNAATNLTGAKIYYTGTANLFSTATLFGSVTSPSGSFVVTGSATLATAGTHYFWLVYDLSPGGTAINNNKIDAQCTSINVGGTPRSPTLISAGGRTISTNLYYSIAPGNWDNATTVWSITSGGPACSCAPTLGNGLVYVNHTISLAATRTVDRVIIENGGVLSNTASNALSVTNGLSTNGTGIFTATSVWTFNGNTTLSRTGTSTSSVSQTFGSNFSLGTGTTFRMTAASGTPLTINGNSTINGTLALSGNNMTSGTRSSTFDFRIRKHHWNWNYHLRIQQNDLNRFITHY